MKFKEEFSHTILHNEHAFAKLKNKLADTLATTQASEPLEENK